MGKAAKGNCFEVNGNYFLEHCRKDGNRDWKLAHGIVTNFKDKLPMSHCWIECAKPFKFPNPHNTRTMDVDIDWVIDKSNGKDYYGSESLYYSAGRIDKDNVVLYDEGEYREMRAMNDTYGPWEIECDR